MRTKHLLFATALVASFAACSNEDLFEAPQNVAKDGRPTVSDVKLNFTEGDAQTRLTFGKNGYAWEETDTIGALLMDQPANLATDEWCTRYSLSQYVNTSYPFTYDPAEKIWSSNAKMLEGNYFFAWPWSSYDGARQVKHSLTEQKQKGVSSSVVAQSYADNQLFIGYAQIKGGTAASDALKDVEMTSVLGAIQLRIINEGSKTYHINKIVLSGARVESEFTFDPTNAAYTGYEIKDNASVNTNDFNYANYVGNTSDKYPGTYTGGMANQKINNADSNYDRMAAIRKVAQGTGAGTSATLIVEGTAEERAVAKGATGYALIMSKPESISALNQLVLTIYTDEGAIQNIDLWKAVTTGEIQNSPAVTEVGPDTSNTVVVKFNDAALANVQASDIYTTADLKQLITWNINTNIAVDVDATLKEDVALTKEVFDLLKTNNLITLNVAPNAAEKLILDAGLPSDVLEYGKMNITAATVVEGEITLTKNTDANAISNLTVAEGGIVNVNAADAQFPGTSLTVNGTLNFGEKATINNAQRISIGKKGTMNVAKGADVKATTGTVTNNGTIENKGYLEGVTNNAAINVGENATLNGLVNNDGKAVVTVNKGARVAGTNTSGIVICNNNEVSVSTGGRVAIAATGSIAKDAYLNSGINTLIISGETTFGGTQEDAVTELIINDGAVVKIADAVVELKVDEVTINGDVTLTSKVGAAKLTAGTMTVTKDAKLTNNGEFKVTTTWTNDGTVYNNGKAELPAGATKGDWRYGDPEINTPSTDELYALVVSIDAGAGAETTSSDLTGGNASTATEKTATFKSLKSLHTFVNTSIAGMKVSVKSIAIESAVTLTYATVASSRGTNDVFYLKAFSDKEIILKNNLSGFDASMGVSLSKLTVKSAATISGVDGMQNEVALTVSALAMDAATTITGMDLKIAGTWSMFNGCKQITGSGNLQSGTGRIVGFNAAGEKMQWNATNMKWIALN